jgi:hypothetical protein
VSTIDSAEVVDDKTVYTERLFFSGYYEKWYILPSSMMEFQQDVVATVIPELTNTRLRRIITSMPPYTPETVLDLGLLQVCSNAWDTQASQYTPLGFPSGGCAGFNWVANTARHTTPSRVLWDGTSCRKALRHFTLQRSSTLSLALSLVLPQAHGVFANLHVKPWHPGWRITCAWECRYRKYHQLYEALAVEWWQHYFNLMDMPLPSQVRTARVPM